jgi:beta-glucosidase
MPGEEREIVFTLTEKDLSFYRADMTWGIEEGRYDVWVGGDSNASEGDYFYIKE